MSNPDASAVIEDKSSQRSSKSRNATPFLRGFKQWLNRPAYSISDQSTSLTHNPELTIDAKLSALFGEFVHSFGPFYSDHFCWMQWVLVLTSHPPGRPSFCMNFTSRRKNKHIWQISPSLILFSQLTRRICQISNHRVPYLGHRLNARYPVRIIW